MWMIAVDILYTNGQSVDGVWKTRNGMLGMMCKHGPLDPPHGHVDDHMG